jgi:P-type conjugative transfer protein TrbJ
MIRTVVTSFALGAVLLIASRARAQMPVTDHANLLQNIRTALQTYQVVQNTAQQIELMQTQIQNELQTLKSINPASFAGLLALLNQGALTYATLQGDLATIGYDVAAVNRNFDRLFPRSQSQWRNVRYSDFNGYYDGWNVEITTSSKAAVRAQSSISSLDANNKTIANILISANSTSTGEVRQLQLINQQLALIHTELGSLVQNLATVGRVITDWAAGSVGEQMMARDRGRRRLDGYTSRGKPSQVLNRLP